MRKVVVSGCAGLILGVSGALCAWAGQPPAKQDEAAAPGARVVDLRPKFRPGQRAGYATQVRMDLSSALKGESDAATKDAGMKMESSISVRVVEADQVKGATIESVVERHKVETKMLGLDSTYNSDDPDDANENAGAAPVGRAKLLGVPMSTKFDAAGREIEVERAPEVKALREGAGVPGLGKGVSAVWMPFSGLAAAAPAASRAVGESWTESETFETTEMGKVRMVAQCRVIRLREEAGGTFADLAMDVTFEPIGEGLIKSNEAARLASRSRMHGEYVWDVTNGWLVSSKLEMVVREPRPASELAQVPSNPGTCLMTMTTKRTYLSTPSN